MGNASSAEEGSHMGHPNLLSKVSVHGEKKADVDAFLAEGKVDKVEISYNTKRQHERFNPRNVNRRVVLRHSTLKLVKRNWAMISEQPEPASSSSSTVTPLVILYDAFFARLFLLEPTLRDMFGDNMIRQSKFLVGLVNIMVGMEGMLKEGLAPIYSFADRSVTIGVRPEHYEVIAAVLPMALEACAGSDGWNKDVYHAWWDVMSFAVLVIVERTVETWGSCHGMSLSEMWNCLYDWRNRTKPNPAKVSKHVRSGIVRTATLSTVASSTMGSNGSISVPPEVPPPLRQSGAKLDSLVTSARSPTVGPSTAGSVAGGGSSGSLTVSDSGGMAWHTYSPHTTCSVASGTTPHASGPQERSEQGEQSTGSGALGGTGATSQGEVHADGARQKGEGDKPTDGGALNSMSSPTPGELQEAARRLRGSGSGSLCTLSSGASETGDFPSGGSININGSHRTPDSRTSPRNPLSSGAGSHEAIRAGVGAGVGAGRREKSSRSPRARSIDLCSLDRSQSVDRHLHERRLKSSSGDVANLRSGIGGGGRSDGGKDPRADGAARKASAAAGGGGGVAANMSAIGGAGGDRSSLPSSGGGHGAFKVLGNTFRRKKITRSASLEEDEDALHRRRRLPLGGGAGLQGQGPPRGRGRDNSLVFAASYVRSQSVTDDTVPQGRIESGVAYSAGSAEFDLEFSTERARRKGIMSRVRRMGSNVIRFRHGPVSSNKHSAMHGRDATGSSNHVRSSHNFGWAGSGGTGAASAAGGDAASSSRRCSLNNIPANLRQHLGPANSMLNHGRPEDRLPNGRPASASPATASATPATGSPEAEYGAAAEWTSPQVAPPLNSKVASRGGGDSERDSKRLQRRPSFMSTGRSCSNRSTGSGSNGNEVTFEVFPADGGLRYHSKNQDGRNAPTDRKEISGKNSARESASRRGGQRGAGVDSAATNGRRGGETGNGRGKGEGSSGGGNAGRPPVHTNPWKQMKLHVLMATLEDSSGEETEKNFEHISEAILHHLGPGEPPTTRAVALDVAQTFVQRVLSSRSKDKKASKVRRRAFKGLLNQLIPLMLDCLSSAGGASAAPLGTREPPVVGDASVSSKTPAGVDLGNERRGDVPAGSSGSSVAVAGQGAVLGGDGEGGEVVVLHYYQQQHHHYLLKVAVLETMNRFLMVLRALFRPPQSTNVQKAVAPLLDAEEDVLREKAAAVLGKLSLCGKDNLKWVNIAIKVSLEAHNLLHDAWADEAAGQIPSKQAQSIMGDHPMLPPLQQTFQPGDAEAHVRAVGRRFPALCKLLATLITASPPKSHESENSSGEPHPEKDQPAANAANQKPLLVSLTISLVQRVLRMGTQAWDLVDSQGADHGREEGTTATASCRGTLSPALAAGVTNLLLPPAVTLLEALVASCKLEDGMKDQHEAVCECMGQAVAQMPVQGGVRNAAYRSMAVVIRYLHPEVAATHLGVPVLPLLFNEALLALGNRSKLQPLNTKREAVPVRRSGAHSKKAKQPLCFNLRMAANNGHGAVIHENTVWAGVECLAVLVLDCGLHLPAVEITEVESVVTEGVDILAHRPLEVSPFNEDEPQMLRHASTREAFVRLVHHYLLLAEDKGRNPAGMLYSEAMLAFESHLHDPDAAVANECRVALVDLKASAGVDSVRVAPSLEEMEVEEDNDMHVGGDEGGYTLEEGENGEFHVVRRGDKPSRGARSPRVPGSPQRGDVRQDV